MTSDPSRRVAELIAGAPRHVVRSKIPVALATRARSVKHG